MLNPDIVPTSLQGHLYITQFDDAPLLMDRLFRRKFGDPAPDFPNHLGAFYRSTDGLRLIGYSHMRPYGPMLLSGGSCTDGDAIRQMPETVRTALAQAGGPWHLILRYAFARYADDCEAFFGHCGDRRALEVALCSGFELTRHQHLIVNWHRPLPAERQEELLAMAHAIGPF